MDVRSLLPLIIVALVGFVVLRMVINAIKTSAKLMFFTIVAVAVLGAGFLWYQNQTDPAGTQPNLPTLNIPSR